MTDSSRRSSGEASKCERCEAAHGDPMGLYFCQEHGVNVPPGNYPQRTTEAKRVSDDELASLPTDWPVERIRLAVAELQAYRAGHRTDYPRPEAIEAMLHYEEIAKIEPGVGLVVGCKVLVVKGVHRGRVGMALSWRKTEDGYGWQVLLDDDLGLSRAETARYADKASYAKGWADAIKLCSGFAWEENAEAETSTAARACESIATRIDRAAVPTGGAGEGS